MRLTDDDELRLLEVVVLLRGVEVTGRVYELRESLPVLVLRFVEVVPVV